MFSVFIHSSIFFTMRELVRYLVDSECGFVVREMARPCQNAVSHEDEDLAAAGSDRQDT